MIHAAKPIPDSESMQAIPFPKRNRGSTTLCHMGANNKKPAKTILWANVLAHMEAKYGRENLNALARDAKIGPASVQRIKDGKTSVGVDIVDKVAKSFGVEAYQLLCPSEHTKSFLVVCRAYSQTDDRGRNLLYGAAQAVLGESGNSKTGTADE